MALALFPLQFQRQDAAPIDIDQTFATTAARLSYLTNPRRYAGLLAADNEEQSVYFMNSSRTAWVPIGGIQFKDEGVALGAPNVRVLNFKGASAVVTRLGGVVTVQNVGSSVQPWAVWNVSATLPPSTAKVNLNTLGEVAPIQTYNNSQGAIVSQLGRMNFDNVRYWFLPVNDSVTHYAISISLKIASTAGHPIHSISFVGSSSPINYGAYARFRKEIPLVQDASGNFFLNETFEYTHRAGATPLYLTLDNVNGAYTEVVTGSISIMKINETPPGTNCAAAALSAIDVEDDSEYLFGTYNTGSYTGGGFGTTVDGTYYGYATFGLSAPPWTFSFSLDWNALPDTPGVAVFSGARAGSIAVPEMDIVVTDAPDIDRTCKVGVAQIPGGWGGLTVNLPGGLSGPATFFPEGGGYWQVIFLLINDHGTVTGEFV